MNISSTINKYKETLSECAKLRFPNIPQESLLDAINYSINKRIKDTPIIVNNSYTNKDTNMTLLKIADYINNREPITTAFGTMFRKHNDVPNPLFDTVQSFLDLRGIHKGQMFSYPKGSEDFEKYNLLQTLDKIDANGIYGTLGQVSALIYNVYVASSITSQGRSLISTATMQFEMLLNNNVKFGCLDEVVEFINYIVKDKSERRFDDKGILDNYCISIEDCFTKLVLSCGYEWIPTDSELDIIWKILCNLPQEDINRIYYKNNLFAFCENKVVMNLIDSILKKLDKPLFNSLDIPDSINEDIKLFGDLIMEYVYYKHMILDRKNKNMMIMKSVVMVSDTDSCIVSLDGWYRFVANKINGKKYNLLKYNGNPLLDADLDEFDELIAQKPIENIKLEYNYDFKTEEKIESRKLEDPFDYTPEKNMKYSIINILAYVIDRIINDYMEQYSLNMHALSLKEIKYNPLTEKEIETGKQYSINGNIFKLENNIPKCKIKNVYNRKCKMKMKNEFTFDRLLMTQVKKNYASLVAVQEGNIIPENKQFDVKGIEILTKSTKALSTRKALKKILIEDVFKAPVIDQLKFLKDITLFEKSIYDSLENSSREYYKPVTIKSINTYENPMRIQGIKGAVAWNYIKASDEPAINLDERNAVTVAKVKINKSIAEKIKSDYPEVYNNINKVLDEIDDFKGQIDAISIPLDIKVPKWLLEFIDVDSIVKDNIASFPFESLGIERMDRDNVNYTNIIKL